MRALTLSALAIFLLDQISKYLVVHVMNLREVLSIDVLPPLLNFRMAWNQGVNFGLFSNGGGISPWVWVAVSVAVSVFVILWMRREAAGLRADLSAGILVGGALGNAVDRVVYGAVADFLNMSCCGINNPFSFNVADIAIFAGAIGLILFTGQKKTP